VTDALPRDLISALSKLTSQFHDDPQSLHFAVSIVFSSIFKKHGLSCVIVGGQSAAYWMRLPGSTDVDFVSPESKKIAIVLEQCGFQKNDDFSFRYNYPETNVLIELVGEQIKIAGLKETISVIVNPQDIEDPLVRSLMPGSAEVLDPALVFINYLDSACQDSIWFDYEDEGALAVERALALLALYNDYILKELRDRKATGELSQRLLQVLRDKFNITI
jgi:hypothetical protein